MDETEALAVFTGKDAQAARAAYNCLCERCRARLIGYLRRQGVTEEDAQDVVQETFLKIWKVRAEFRNQGVPEWWVYLKRSAIRLYIDLVRKRKKIPVPVEWEEEKVPPDQRPLLDSILMAVLTQRLYHCANVHWLALDPNLPADTHNLRLLTAMRYYLDGDPLPDLLHSLSSTLPGETPPTPGEVRSWLRDPGVLRHLAFERLYYSNDRLTGRMLFGDRGAAGTLLDDLTALAENQPPMDLAFSDLTWIQVSLVLWHYRNAMSLADILKKLNDLEQQQRPIAGWDYDSAKLASLLDSLTVRLPFNQQMEQLLYGFSRNAEVHAWPFFKQRKLWERLVFQYAYHDALSPDQIVERILPAVKSVEQIRPSGQTFDFEINRGTITMWTSGGRLRDKLVKFWKEAYGGDFDE